MRGQPAYMSQEVSSSDDSIPKDQGTAFSFFDVKNDAQNSFLSPVRTAAEPTSKRYPMIEENGLKTLGLF